MATVEAPRVRTGNVSPLPKGPFRTEPLTDFSKDENRRAMKEALAKVKSELGREYDLVIGGELLKTTAKIRSTNPAKPSEVVGIHQRAEREHAEPAMKAALAAFEKWKYATIEERAGLLVRTGAILRERKHEF